MNLDKSLADIFVEEGYVSVDRLEEILATREDTTEPLGDLLVRMGLISDQQRLKCVGLQSGLPFVDLANFAVRPEVANLIPKRVALRLQVLPIEATELSTTVAMKNPLDVNAIDELSSIMDRDVDPMWAAPEDLRHAINQAYGIADEVRVVESMPKPSQSLRPEPAGSTLNTIIGRALRMGATDIHLEPGQDHIRVRCRVDGVLREILTVPKGDVLAQIKRVSGLRVEEADYSQSGHCRMKTPNGELDLRVSTFPGIAGERVAISILDKDTIRLTLDQLGVSGRVLSEFRRVLELRQGFVLVAGASGSGRTTTLYAALTHLNTANRNILTIEDPVEYVIPGITQGLVNPATGITFASGLRSILRQDADVILVGDLRDRETGQLALESSHARRLVLSAIDSQDCATSIGHLLGMGIDPTLVAGSVTAVMAQRLISSNCPHCLRAYAPDPDLLNRHGLPVEHEYLRGEGCDACSNTGLLGRIAVLEFFELNPKTRKMILAGKSIGDIRDHMVERGMRTLDQEAASLVLAGKVCIEGLSQLG